MGARKVGNPLMASPARGSSEPPYVRIPDGWLPTVQVNGTSRQGLPLQLDTPTPDLNRLFHARLGALVSIM